MQQHSQNPFGINQSNRSQLHQFLMSGAGINSSPVSGLSQSGPGVNAPAGSALSAGLLSQLESASSKAPSATSETATENIAALAGAQRLLGFGNSSQRTGNGNANIGGNAVTGGRGLGLGALGAAASTMESGGVSDALSLLARAIPRGDGNNHVGFGGIPDRQDGAADRYSPS
jgi:hypothetical protein